MTTQTLTIGNRRFVLLPERDFLRLKKKALANEVKPEFAQEAMRELSSYRKAGKAVRWEAVKKKLGT